MKSTKSTQNQIKSREIATKLRLITQITITVSPAEKKHISKPCSYEQKRLGFLFYCAPAVLASPTVRPLPTRLGFKRRLPPQPLYPDVEK